MSLNFSQLFPELEKAVNDAIDGNWLGVGVDVIKGIAGIFNFGDSTPNAVKSQLQGVQLTGDQILQLKMLENQVVAEKFAQMESEINDTENARTIQAETKSKLPAVLSITWIVVSIAFMAFIFGDKHWITSSVLSAMIGWMAHATWKKIDQIFDFWFGSKEDTADK
jgi:hypothetical protein